MSVALFSPKYWMKIPPYDLSTTQEAGFCPPCLAQYVSYPTSCEESALSGKETQEETTHEEESCAMTSPSPDAEALLQERCAQKQVSLPMMFSARSDAMTRPFSAEEQDELTVHIFSGHLTKNHLWRDCLVVEGPRQMHRLANDGDTAMLQIDMAGPITWSDDGFN